MANEQPGDLPVVLVLASPTAAADGTLATVEAALDGARFFRTLVPTHGPHSDFARKLVDVIASDSVIACVLAMSGPVDEGLPHAGSTGQGADLVELALATRPKHIISASRRADASDRSDTSRDVDAVATCLSRLGLDEQAVRAQLGSAFGASGAALEVGTRELHMRSVCTDAVRAAVEAAVAGGVPASGRRPDGGADGAALLLRETRVLGGVGPVLIGRVVGMGGAPIAVRRGTALVASPSGATATARSMELVATGQSREVECAEPGREVALLCEGAAVPPGFGRGSLVRASAASPFPAGFAVTSRFRAVLVPTHDDAAHVLPSARLGVALMYGTVHCNVESITPVSVAQAGQEGGDAASAASIAVLRSARPAVLCTHGDMGELGRGGVRLLPGDGSSPAVAVALVTAMLPGGDCQD